MAEITKASNKNLHKASKAKKDEFYTQLVDIEKELRHYKDQFRGKVVYCNCDDPFESNFFKYFASKFNELKLKKLIATSYKPSPIANTEIVLQPSLLLGYEGKILKQPAEPKGRPKTTANKFIINEVGDLNGNGAFDLEDIAEQLKANKNNEWAPLEGDGDFRSPESIELLNQADIVVTNPPFSLFREYVAQLMEYKKKFLVIGHQNAITYKECFKLLKDNKMWLGFNNFDNSRFVMPAHYDVTQSSYAYVEDGVKYGRVSGLRWYTNLDTAKRHEKMILYKNYNSKEYPKYDNYDAIEVSKTLDIPQDYNDVMGVPITFLDKYNPEQFNIVGHVGSVGADGVYSFANAIYLDRKKMFKRILIKFKS